MSKVFHNISEVRLSEVHLSKVHHHLCGIVPFHRFTKNFLLIQDPPWPKETIEVYSKANQGSPPSLWDTTISQVHQEFPSYPRSTLAQGNHKDVSKVHQGPTPPLWNTNISQVHQEFPFYPRSTQPKEIIKVYPRSTKVHYHLCGIQPFHRFTKKFLSIQDPPWPKETI